MSQVFTGDLIDLESDGANRVSVDDSPHQAEPYGLNVTADSISRKDSTSASNQFSFTNQMSSIDLLDASSFQRDRNTVTFDGASLLKSPNANLLSPPKLNSHGGVTTQTVDTSVFIPPSVSRYLEVPRNEFDISTKKVILKESRPASQGDLRKLRDLAVQPLEHKFDVIPLDDSEKQILNNYNLQMRVKDLQRNLERYDMGDVFKILRFPNDQDVDVMLKNSIPIQPLTTTINLLENWDEV